MRDEPKASNVKVVKVLCRIILRTDTIKNVAFGVLNCVRAKFVHPGVSLIRAPWRQLAQRWRYCLEPRAPGFAALFSGLKDASGVRRTFCERGLHWGVVMYGNYTDSGSAASPRRLCHAFVYILLQSAHSSL